MGSTELAARYTAKDGTEVSLDRESVTKYVLTGNSQVSDAELATFIGVCRSRGINPVAREAYMVKYGTSPAAIIVSKDYYVRTAREQETFDGYEAGVVVARADGSVESREGSFLAPGETLLGGWARVYDRAVAHPYCDSVSLSEYSTGKSGWARMPATMIRKVALVHALREAYPGVFAGLYDAGEMDQARERASVPAQPVEVEGQAERDPARHARQALAADEADALRVLAEWAARSTGEDERGCKARMVEACGNPLDCPDFGEYYARAQAWAQAEVDMYGEAPVEPEEVTAA